jgi:putative hydrolase
LKKRATLSQIKLPYVSYHPYLLPPEIQTENIQIEREGNIFNVTQTKHVPMKMTKLIEMNTRAYCNTIKNNPIDALTHVNYLCKCNSLEVAKVAADYGTYLELNSKKEHFTNEELMDMALKTSVRFLINSDAHSADRVGEIERVKAQLGRLNFPLDRIDNIDGRLPNFRFKEFKQRL